MTQITQSFIFAAGRGERMMPLTANLPKPLIKIKNKSIIDYSIEKLDRLLGVQKIIINGFYLGEQIGDHIKKLGNPKIIFSHETEKLETAGGLLFAKDKIDFNQPILTINGDVLWQENGVSDLELICRNWNPQDHDILLGLKKTPDYLGYDGNVTGGGDFYFENGKLHKNADKKMTHVFVGIQIINPKILLKAEEDGVGKCFSMSHFYRSAVDKNGILQRVSGIELTGKYFHIGTPEALKMTEENL